jgi:hypothetical protein
MSGGEPALVTSFPLFIKDISKAEFAEGARGRKPKQDPPVGRFTLSHKEDYPSWRTLHAIRSVMQRGPT